MEPGYSLYQILTIGAALLWGAAYEDWSGFRHYHKIKSELIAQGESLEFQDFVPEPIPNEDNFGMAPVLQGALESKEPPVLDEVLDELGDLVHSEVLTEEMACTLAEGLQPWLPIRQQLVDRLHLPRAQWNSVYDVTQNVLDYPPIDAASITMDLRRLCMAHGALQAFHGDQNALLTDIRLVLRLAELLEREPRVIAAIIRLSHLSCAFNLIERGLLERKWTDQQLAILGSWLSDIDSRADVIHMLRSQRSVFFAIERELLDPDSRERLRKDLGGGWIEFAPDGWIWRSIGDLGAMYQDCIEVLESDRSFGDQSSAIDVRMREAESGSLRSWLCDQESRTMTIVSDAFVDLARECAVLRAAVTIERFRFRQGRVPKQLDELVTMPLDPLTDQPLVFVRNGDAYSILAPEEGNTPETPENLDDLCFASRRVGKQGKVPRSDFEIDDL